MRKKIALATVALLLTACTPTFGTAAVVGDEKVSLSSVQESVQQIINQRIDTGEPSAADIAGGELAQDQLRFQIISLVFVKAAKKVGVTITPAEFEAYRAQVLQSVGGEQGLLIPLTQNSIALKDFETYLMDVLYQKKIGEKLVAGDDADTTVSNARSEAVKKLINEVFSENKVVVNPRFGQFDSTSTLITEKDYTNGALQPRG